MNGTRCTRTVAGFLAVPPLVVSASGLVLVTHRPAVAAAT